MGSGTTDGKRLGPYTLGPRIGRGGMGVVYAATSHDGTLVAVKQLQVSEDGASGVNVQRFLDEARLGATLEHPNVVRTFEGGVDEGRAWLAMELLEGAPLSSVFRLPTEGLELDVVLGLATQMLDALEYLHEQKGVIHRDVKPSNVFITNDGVVKLIDFGIAVAESLDATATATGAVRGSFPFVSPEYLRSEPLDARADLFSFGLVLHELLTGSRVFSQTSQAAVVSAILFGVIAPVRTARPDVPQALDDELRRVLSRDPGQRHADARTLRLALLAAAGVEPASRRELAAWLAARKHATATQGAVEAPRTRSQAVIGEVSRLPGPAPARRRGFWFAGLLGAAVVASLGIGWQASRWSPPDAVAEVALRAPAEAEPAAAPAPVDPAPAPVPSPAPPEPARSPVEGAPTPPPTARPGRGSGFVTVDAQPTWAKISIDGKTVGPTPLYRHVAKAGAHRVEATTEDGRRKTRTVTVQKDQETRVLFEW